MNPEPKITNVSEYINLIGSITKAVKENNEKNENKMQIYFRGQGKQFGNTLPSLMHYKGLLDNEDKLISDFLAEDPSLFSDSHNNFDRLALMQHHQLPTRLLDLTTNPLVALYFAVEDDNGEPGEIFPFTNLLNGDLLDKSLKYNKLDGLFSDIASYKNDHQFLRSPFSDTVEIEASLSRLHHNDRETITDQIFGLYAQLNKEKSKNSSDFTWYNIYENVILSNIPSQRSKQLTESSTYQEYLSINALSSTQRLYHEIRKDVSDFEEIIDPLEMYVPKIVTPRIIDDRIKNQRGLFMLVPPISKQKSTEPLDYKAQNEIEIDMQNRINILRLNGTDNQPIKLTVPYASKAEIRKELKMVGITSDFIYPNHSSFANEISGRYKI